MPGDKTPASVSDGSCLTVDVPGAHHEVGFAKADGCMADSAACFARRATDEAGGVSLSPDPADCTTENGNFCAGATAAMGGLLASA